MNVFQKLTNFDTMITPTIIKIIFWVGVGVSVIFGIFTSLSGLFTMFSGFGDSFIGFFTFIFGLIIIVVGVLMSRVYAELMIVVFKIQESLHSIDQKTNDHKLP